MSIDNEKIIVEGFKKNPDTNAPLPAESSKLINIGDELLEIDNNNLQTMKVSKIVEVLKSMNNKRTDVNIRFNSKINNKLLEENYKTVCSR